MRLLAAEGRHFTDLGNATVLCGQWGAAEAAVWLNGTRAAVAAGCGVRRVGPAELRLTLPGGLESVPSSTERVRVAVRPGLLGSGSVPADAGYFLLQPDGFRPDSAGPLTYMPSAIPGASLLGVMLRTCHSEADAPPVGGEELERINNPFNMSIGTKAWASYHGAMVGNGLIVSVCILCCATLYFVIASTVRRNGASLPRRRILEHARCGWIIVPLQLVYPGWSLVCLSVCLYGDTISFRLLAGVLLLGNVVTPIFVFYAVHTVGTYAQCAPIVADKLAFRCPEKHQRSNCGWAVTGWREWQPLSPATDAHFHQYRLFFFSFKTRDKHFLSCNLVWALLVASIQVYRPRSSAGCEAQGYSVVILMLMRVVWVTVRRVHISPCDNFFEISVGWAEWFAKLAAVFFSHSWGGPLEETLKQIVTGLLGLSALYCISTFVVDQYDRWRQLVGKWYPDRGWRLVSFILWWFFFWRVSEVAAAAEGWDLRKEGTSQGEPLPPLLSPATEAASPSGNVLPSLSYFDLAEPDDTMRSSAGLPVIPAGAAIKSPAGSPARRRRSTCRRLSRSSGSSRGRRLQPLSGSASSPRQSSIAGAGAASPRSPAGVPTTWDAPRGTPSSPIDAAVAAGRARRMASTLPRRPSAGRGALLPLRLGSEEITPRPQPASPPRQRAPRHSSPTRQRAASHSSPTRFARSSPVSRAQPQRGVGARRAPSPSGRGPAPVDLFGRNDEPAS